MNAVEIESAVSDLALEPFNAAEFPFQFLAAFDRKETTLRRLRRGDSNKSDVPGGVLLQNSIHLAVCAPGQTPAMLQRLRQSPKTASGKAKFIFATDGEIFEAEDLASTAPIAGELSKLADHLGYFLPLAGISTVREIKDNPIDIRATGRLNKLYVELLRLNPEWATEARRHDMNHFMARLIFCFFAEDTGIFYGESLFTNTVEQFTESDGSNTQFVIERIFRAMNVHPRDRAAEQLPASADQFPYVNGGLFSGSTAVPAFSRIARSYLLQAGKLNWQQINPDIFGSMIQAVADDEERGALGMHYTSVPNILKVLNPLFLDDLREKLAAANGNKRTLRNLLTRMSRIRVFDPACGSGNFLVIAYKQMRMIEADIYKAMAEEPRLSVLSLKNFRGIEIRDFAVEIARLALVIAEYQSNVAFLGKEQANIVFLPLANENWITWGNALRLDWLQLCPPEGTGVKLHEDDLFATPKEQAEVDFENEGGEVFICGNPPYAGSVMQTLDQKNDLKGVYGAQDAGWKSLDYVAGWFVKAIQYASMGSCHFAFVATNSVCQGEQVPILWPRLFAADLQIQFAFTSFKWSNLAAHKAGVTVVIVGCGARRTLEKKFYVVGRDGELKIRSVANIGPYLVPGPDLIVQGCARVPDSRATMIRGNMANDGGHLVLSSSQREAFLTQHPQAGPFIRRMMGSKELISATSKYCIWVEDAQLSAASVISGLCERFALVRATRSAGGTQARQFSELSHRFVFTPHQEATAIVVPRVSSESRDYLPVDVTTPDVIISDRNFALYDAPLWNMALIASRLHWVWIGTVCVRMRTDFSYSNTLGWNTFPVPTLTETDKADLTRCAENILLAREAHFPATIADLYDPEAMPENLRAAHDANDETLERIYIGRRFKNDTERLEHLFALYTKMTAAEAAGGAGKGKAAARKPAVPRKKAESAAALPRGKKVMKTATPGEGTA